MTDNIFEMVEEFNREVLQIRKRKVGFQDFEEFKLSVAQLEEELAEFKEAYEFQNHEEVIDAMLDLIYFACGVCYKSGVSSKALLECFRAIHTANMEKAKGKKLERDYDGDAADAMKPEGWQPPKLKEIIEQYNEE